MAAGVPDFMLFIVEPVYFIQTPKEVLIIYTGNNETRHIHMNAEHDRNARPTFYGDSIGHYEGDTLVVDTVKLNAKTYVDNYSTPHTEKLHVVERWKLIDGGKTLEVSFTADDPDTFNQPWSGIQRYRRVQPEPLQEEPCAENNTALFDYHIPQAEKPDLKRTAIRIARKIRGVSMPVRGGSAAAGWPAHRSAMVRALDATARCLQDMVAVLIICVAAMAPTRPTPANIRNTEEMP